MVYFWIIMIEIIEIDLKNKKEKERFINFDYQIYQNDPFWVAPLRMEIGQRLDVKKHPFYQLGAIQCFMAIKDGKDAGRIAAINNMKYNEFHGSKVGFLAFLNVFMTKKWPICFFIKLWSGIIYWIIMYCKAL